eukprot:Lithocolla_globosa_v1_NODE_324_length_4471_cov_1015.959466.p4 type:complete len:112 gc:universal NODE_324_length_4471_cov_1015.959466:2798-3133(+)
MILKSGHQCYNVTCKVCGVNHDERSDHKCYIRPPAKLHVVNDNYTIFDFEATQNTGKHIVNLAVAQYMDNDKNYIFRSNKEFCMSVISTTTIENPAISNISSIPNMSIQYR